MSARPDPSHPLHRTTRSRCLSLSAALLASGFLALSFPIDASGPHGGSGGGSRGGSGGGHSYSGGGRGSSGGSRSYSSGSRSSSGTRSYSGGGRSYSSGTRSSSSGWRSWSSSPTSSTPVRSASGDRAYGSSGTAGGWGGRSVIATGSRGGSGGPPSSGGGHPGGNPGSGGHPGGGHPGGGGGHGGDYHGGYHHGGYHGWYCPPVYWAGSSWYWGGPWDWWWGWGPYWGAGWGWGWGGGVYVINEGEPAANRYARVDTDVSPEAAEVYLDGTYIGSADDFDGYPDYLYLAPGKYRLEFRHPFYETIVKELDVTPGQSLQFEDEMKLLPGKKKLEVVDPQERGTPLGRVFGRPEAKAEGQGGDRTGRFDAEGTMDSDAGEIRATDVDVLPPALAKPGAGTAAPPEEVAPAERGRLRFEVEPDDAVVYLDDRYAGTGEELGGLRRGLAVKPGRHTVTVTRPGYKSRTIDVEAKPGSAIDVVIELEK